MDEIKKSIEGMTASERLEIGVLIAHLNRADSPEFQREIDRRMTAMDVGKKASSEDFVRRHDALLRQGR